MKMQAEPRHVPCVWGYQLKDFVSLSKKILSQGLFFFWFLKKNITFGEIRLLNLTSMHGHGMISLPHAWTIIFKWISSVWKLLDAIWNSTPSTAIYWARILGKSTTEHAESEQQPVGYFNWNSYSLCENFNSRFSTGGLWISNGAVGVRSPPGGGHSHMKVTYECHQAPQM